MSNDNHSPAPQWDNNSYPQQWGQNSKPVKPKKHRFRKALAYTGVGVLGLVIGSASAATAEPEVVTKTKEVEVPVEKIVEEEVPVTPQACIDALDAAETAFEAYSAGFGAAAEAMGAIQTLDVAAIEAANQKMGRIQQDELEPALVNYWIVSEGCRSK